ncbi:MAG: hypothetical protein KAH22_03675 [Thiotrichaceae bacterium]|nr:hypothetical protein [Thiotrichaceae bacterium]
MPSMSSKIRFYSHSTIFYFWPLWLISLTLGFLTVSHTFSVDLAGVIFLFSLLFSLFVITIDVRGLWVVIFVLGLIVLGLLFERTGVMRIIYHTIISLKISIEPNFYFLFAIPMAVVWLFTTVLYDRRKYVELRPNELTVVKEIGEGVVNYDTMGIVFRKKRDNFIQHWIFGLGSGDLVITTGSGGGHKEVIYINNVFRIGNKINRMHQVLENKR